MRIYLSLLCLVACTTVLDRRTQFNLFPLSEDVRLGEVAWKSTLNLRMCSRSLARASKSRTHHAAVGGRHAAAASSLAESFDGNGESSGRQPSQCLVPPRRQDGGVHRKINFVTNDDQLAAVMGHELPRRGPAWHGTPWSNPPQVVLAATDGELNDREPRMAESAFGLGVALPFSRAHEHEADELGTYCRRRG